MSTAIVPYESDGEVPCAILNQTTTPKTVRVSAGKRELLTQQATGDTLELGILGVAVLEMQVRVRPGRTSKPGDATALGRFMRKTRPAS